jgi:hypothetical protein
MIRIGVAGRVGMERRAKFCGMHERAGCVRAGLRHADGGRAGLPAHRGVDGHRSRQRQTATPPVDHSYPTAIGALKGRPQGTCAAQAGNQGGGGGMVRQIKQPTASGSFSYGGCPRYKASGTDLFDPRHSKSKASADLLRIAGTGLNERGIRDWWVTQSSKRGIRRNRLQWIRCSGSQPVPPFRNPNFRTRS